MCIAVGWNHPLAKADIKEISLIDLKDELFFVHASSSDERDAIIDFAEKRDLSPEFIKVIRLLLLKCWKKEPGRHLCLITFLWMRKVRD